MIKLSIAVFLLVEVEPFVCSHELNLSEIFLVLLVPYFDLYLSAMPEFCRICTRLKIKKDQKKNMFQAHRQSTPMEIYQFKGARSTIHK